MSTKAPGPLSNWDQCNDFLRACTEKQASELLAKEKKGSRRIQYLLRIHSRINVLRAKRERSELLKVSA
jgi:hypothetical protein